jgi:hypothetical protein
MNEVAYRSILRRLGTELPPPRTEEVAQLLPMSLDVFARDGQPIEIRVLWWPETLWFVPNLRHAEALQHEGIGRARVWTACELNSMLEAGPRSTGALCVTMIACREFGGEVVAVRPSRLP